MTVTALEMAAEEAPFDRDEAPDLSVVTANLAIAAFITVLEGSTLVVALNGVDRALRAEIEPREHHASSGRYDKCGNTRSHC